MLSVSGLTVLLDGMPVLRDLSFHVHAGEIVAIVGANGAGKTTLANTLSGLVRSTGGSVRLDGLRLDGCSARDIFRHGVAHVPEGRRLFAQMSVEENLICGSLFGAAKSRRPETLAFLYKRLPLLRSLQRRAAGTLSGGEQQMVAIGRALMSLPRLLILDEPTVGLAPLMLREIFDLLGEIGSRGVAVVLAEQNVRQSLALCDRALVLQNGRIVARGGGSQLAADPRVTAALLGI